MSFNSLDIGAWPIRPSNVFVVSPVSRSYDCPQFLRCCQSRFWQMLIACFCADTCLQPLSVTWRTAKHDDYPPGTQDVLGIHGWLIYHWVSQSKCSVLAASCPCFVAKGACRTDGAIGSSVQCKFPWPEGIGTAHAVFTVQTNLGTVSLCEQQQTSLVWCITISITCHCC